MAIPGKKVRDGEEAKYMAGLSADGNFLPGIHHGNDDDEEEDCADRNGKRSSTIFFGRNLGDPNGPC